MPRIAASFPLRRYYLLPTNNTRPLCADTICCQQTIHAPFAQILSAANKQYTPPLCTYICSIGYCAFRSTSAWLYRRELCSMRRAGCSSFPILGGRKQGAENYETLVQPAMGIRIFIKIANKICVFQKFFVPLQKISKKGQFFDLCSKKSRFSGEPHSINR